MNSNFREGKDRRNKLFSTEKNDGVTVLTFCDKTENLLGMDIEAIEPLWQFFSGQERNPSKAIVLHLPSSAFGPQSMDRVLAAHGVERYAHVPRHAFFDSSDFVRQANAARRFIEAVTDTEAVVILTLRGGMLLSLFGPALACDFRVACDDFMLQNRMTDYVLTPPGALPWFLTRLVGKNKACEMMQQSRDMTAVEAMEFGLVEKVVPKEDVLNAAVAMARDIAARPFANREAIKQTSIFAGDSLKAYMAGEETLFKRSLAKLRAADTGGGTVANALAAPMDDDT